MWSKKNAHRRRKEKTERKCKHCGASFDSAGAKVFCNPKCKIDFHNAARPVSGIQSITCEYCKTVFAEPRKSGIGKRYCSKLCASRARKQKWHPLRPVFDQMWSRCTNPNNTSYDRYGARGIAVCNEWRDFDRFCADMGDKPSPKHTLDRIDSNGGYEPNNCRWATKKQQSRNRTNTIDQNTANAIKEFFRLGKSNKEIAALMAIPYSKVQCVTSGKTWRDD